MFNECCGCADLVSEDDYSTGLHVASAFILFVVSAAGTLLPVVSKRVPAMSSNSMIIEWLMTFGFGVAIATVFIHMMNDGIEMLSNPCLGEVVEDYESLGMAVVLATVVVMHLIECESSVFFAGKMQPCAIKNTLATVLFGVGVLFHSVIIGIDLWVTGGHRVQGAARGDMFHQFFEGTALSGNALGAMKSLQSMLMVHFAFAVTTPVGVVIGILIRFSYSSTSATGLWAQGTLNCIAAGILVYAGLVELLANRMTINSEFLGRRGTHRFLLHTVC